MKFRPNLLGIAFGYGVGLPLCAILSLPLGQPLGFMLGSACVFACSFLLIEFGQFRWHYSDFALMDFADQAYFLPGLLFSIGFVMSIKPAESMNYYEFFAILLPISFINVAFCRIMFRITFTREQLDARNARGRENRAGLPKKA